MRVIWGRSRRVIYTAEIQISLPRDHYLPCARTNQLYRRKALEVDFASVPLKYIDQQLKQHGNLYPAYLAIHQAEQTYDSNRARLYQRLAKPRKSTSASDMSSAAPIKCRMEEFSKELLAVRAKREKDEGEFSMLRCRVLCTLHLSFLL